MKSKITAAVLCTVMILYISSTIISPVFADEDTVVISSKQDFIDFSKKCTLDTWSSGKSINLNCDLNFSDGGFLPVPTFGGVFNGNGYTVSGIRYYGKGSYMGIFRYVQQGGKISGLNVKAEFVMNGSKKVIGGIAGENCGSIEQCSFEGVIKGQNVIGGIAGNNADGGRIVSCTSRGSVTGENYTGGIAGKNSGFIQNCTNNAAVNTAYEEKKKSIADIDADTGAIIENIKNHSEENEEESVLGNSDTGGVVGYSSGIVQGCVNNANIGYKHIGYNVGGIAGRQSGYMLGCKNYGFVQGRKDVGGIVGQVEPYILLNVSESSLTNIRRELDELNSTVNRFLTDNDDLGADTEKHLTDISKSSKTARDNADKLLKQGETFADDNIGEINAQAAILSNTFDKMKPIFEKLEKSGENFVSALDEASAAIDDISLYIPELEDEINHIKSAMDNIAYAEDSIKSAVTRGNKAINNLDDAITYDNKAQVDQAVTDLKKSVKDIITAKQTVKSELEKIETTLKTKPENFEEAGIDLEKASESIKIIRDNVDITISSLKTIEKSLDTVILNANTDFTKFRSAAKNITTAVSYLSNSLYYIRKGMDDLCTAFEGLYKKADEYTGDANGKLRTVTEGLQKSLGSLSPAVEEMASAASDMGDIITDLSNEDPVEFVKLDEEFKNAGDGLFNSLSDISGEIDNLEKTVSQGRKNVTGNLSSISNQFNSVTNLLIDEFENTQNVTRGFSDIFLDVSEEDIENTKQGKVAECHNYGNVNADRSVGGISGAMAIEYAKDPEDDIEKPDSLNFTYRTKAILQGCINDGNITGKKDCVGGIVGLSEIGTVYECQNYADIESANGNYVGGVAGKSASAIRRSYAKNKLTGKRYTGGIAGKADIVTACYTIVNVNGEENTGAICGDVENSDDLFGNFYVDNGLGAVDGISYSGKAVPVDFEELKMISGIPERFISFTVTFIADGKVVETRDIKYGDDTAGIKYPEIPKKEGCFGSWQHITAGTVTENIEVLCEYKPYITILSSKEKNSNGGPALALCEGEFTDKALLHITKSKQKPPVETIGDTEVYDISLLNTDIKDGDKVTVRILNENKDKVTVRVLKNGNWKKVKTKYRGKYVILEITGTNSTVCLQYKKRSGIIFVVIIIIVTVLICMFLFLKKRGNGFLLNADASPSKNKAKE